MSMLPQGVLDSVRRNDRGRGPKVKDLLSCPMQSPLQKTPRVLHGTSPGAPAVPAKTPHGKPVHIPGLDIEAILDSKQAYSPLRLKPLRGSVHRTFDCSRAVGVPAKNPQRRPVTFHAAATDRGSVDTAGCGATIDTVLFSISTE